tara:strand:+ start:5290 stop:5574 length:285 start_codon:yes stop_codon:yes gene_type:complete
MSYKPVNRMIMLEVEKAQEEEATVLLPEGYKPPEQYGFAKIVETASDCKGDFSVGDEIIFENSMLQTVNLGEEEINLLLENYVLAITNVREKAD